MPTPQVFIVDEVTFPLHLKYRFAGTTAGKEREKHIGLLADISRVRPGDPVIFYQVERGFYGVFQIAETHKYPFWEKRNGWLQSELGRPLIYRVLIEPLEVYRRPITEWEAIDKLPLYARDVRWSLLYRKLKGERGCSYLFPHEYQSLKELLKSANPEGPIAGPNEPDELALVNGEIRVRKGISKEVYKGSHNSPFHHIDLRATEMHLEAWFVWHIGKEPHINSITGNPVWFANEVFMGSGMQRVDVLCISVCGSKKEFRLIELKFSESTPEELDQFRRYIWWIKSYVWEEGDEIQPIWISRGFPKLKEVIESVKRIANGEECREAQIYRWELAANYPRFIPLHIP
ncbi:hypothetical protein M1N57_00250 [Dehalococcoidales bacterium]|nr:hypothetical protein [Dehalococcoidales bacterium]